MKRLSQPPVLTDTALLIARVILGAVLVAHGAQKLFDNGIAATADGFGQMGIPVPQAAAWFAALVEFGGGILLIVGALMPLVGVLVAINMFGAFWFAHREAGVFVTDGGWELVAVIGALGLLLAATGAGRFSVDQVVLGRSRVSQPATAAA